MRKLLAKLFRSPKPDRCWNCHKSDYLVWDNGEWKCSNCHTVQDQ